MPRTYIEWFRRVRRGKPPGPWRAGPTGLTGIDFEPTDFISPGWEHVILPEGIHPDPQQVPGSTHDLGGSD